MSLTTRQQYMIEEMKAARSAIDAQMREHERLMFFSITAFGAAYLTLVVRDLAAHPVSIIFALIPVILSIYGLIREHAMVSFAAVTDRYLSEFTERSFLGGKGGYLAHYSHNKRSSYTRLARRLFWFCQIILSAVGLAMLLANPAFFDIPATSPSGIPASSPTRCFGIPF